MKNLVLISPSVLSADFGRLNEVIEQLDRCKVDSVHLDVMDGIFVPNITIGPVVIEAIRKHTKLPFETHLMIERPDRYIRNFADAGSDTIIVHYESKHRLEDTIGLIRSCNKRVGLSINPQTEFNAIKNYMQDVDMLLVMSVNPGFGGQKFMPESLEKIRAARAHIDKMGYQTIVAVDGGITLQNAREVIAAGADELIAGSAIFGADDVRKAIEEFKGLKQ